MSQYYHLGDILVNNSSFEWIIADSKTLSIHSSNITITNSSFQYNNGSLRADGKSYVYITGSVFLNNTGLNGGAIYANNSSVIYLRGTSENKFSLNTVESSGGAIQCRNCTLTITGCNSFQNNTARLSGGAINIVLGSLVITNITCTSFSGNKAKYGGAIHLFGCNTSIN